MSHDLLHVLQRQRMEEDDLVDPVDELRPEVLPQRLGDLPPDTLGQVAAVFAR